MSLDFYYELPWRATSPHPGAHASVIRGGTEEFSGFDAFIANPQARHIDVRASLLDPLGQWRVRSFRQRASIGVEIIADFSTSMSYRGEEDKQETLARFVEMVAWSAYRQGDRFGFQAGSDRLFEELTLPSRLYKGGVPEFCTKLRYHRRQGSGVRGLLEACERMGRARSLVFLVSDFHLPSQQITEVLERLAGHDLVPVILWDRTEYEALPDFGLMVLADPETGEKRRLWMRPALRAAFKERYDLRKAELVRLTAALARNPIFLDAGFVADDLTRYFLMGG
mgnify:FL=1